MEFLKSSDLELNAAGYLVSKVSKLPVTLPEFVKQQKAAEYVVKLGAAIKGKTFKCEKLDNLDEVKSEVLKAIAAANTREYVATPEKPVSAVNDELVKFALDFNNFKDAETNAAKINRIMAEFDKIADVEQVGDYFSEGLSKLTKIYTVAEILAATQLADEKIG
jgi:uncharacterized protein YoaH (UPF0181 family)